MTIRIRVAKTDQDTVAIHRFLCVVAGPHLPGAIDAKKSIHEVWRVVNHEVAFMAMNDDLLVGTLGIIRADYWWGDAGFLANRWFFSVPNSGAGKPLLDHGETFAKQIGLELHIIDESRGRLVILNRDPRRDTANAPAAGVIVEEAPSPAHTLQ